MVGYDSQNNALTLGDDDSLKVGDYELQYDSTSDEFQAEYDRPIGGETGNHGEIVGFDYISKNTNGIRGDSRENIVNTGFNTSNLGSTASFVADVKVNDPTESNHMIGTLPANGEQITLSYNYLGTGFGIVVQSSGTLERASVGTETDANEHTVIGVVDSTEIRIYVDGTLETTTARSVQIVDEELGVGKRFDGSGTLNGELYRARVYSEALTDTEASDIASGTEITTGLEIDYQFNYPETPNLAIDSTGEAFPKNSIPRSTSGSLVPQGLADVVSQGEVLADNGEIYTSVQTAVDNSTGFVFIGPGTFNESVTISTQGLTLQGSGHDTLIDGGASDNALIVNAANLKVSDISLQTANGGTTCLTTNTDADTITVENVKILNSGGNGMSLNHGEGHMIRNCVVVSTNFIGIRIESDNVIVTGCIIRNCGSNGIITEDFGSVILSNNLIEDTSNFGILTRNDDHIIIGNRVHNTGSDGIDTFAGSNIIIANNRVSDSDENDIDANTSNTILDGNKTGPSN
jgi:hypothetical protein